MDSGLASEDQYNIYSKPLFTDRGSNLYRPNKGQDDELYGGGAADGADVRTERFKPTKVNTATRALPSCIQMPGVTGSVLVGTSATLLETAPGMSKFNSCLVLWCVLPQCAQGMSCNLPCSKCSSDNSGN